MKESKVITEEVEEPSWWGIEEEEMSKDTRSEESAMEQEEERSDRSSGESMTEDDPEEEDQDKFLIRMITDCWHGPNKKGEVYHLNKTGKKVKVHPEKDKCPVDFRNLEKKRVTVKTKEGKSVREEDEWNGEDEKPGKTWTGLTMFFVKQERKEIGKEEQEREEYFKKRTVL